MNIISMITCTSGWCLISVLMKTRQEKADYFGKGCLVLAGFVAVSCVKHQMKTCAWCHYLLIIPVLTPEVATRAFMTLYGTLIEFHGGTFEEPWFVSFSSVRLRGVK